MNKKVIRVMIGLVVIFLVGLYVLKIFMPEEFVMAIQNERFITVGNYIDTHKWAYYTFGVCTSFITYWLYCCAVCKRWYLNWWQCLVVLATIGASIGLSFYDAKLCSALSYTSFAFLPAIFGSDIKRVALVYTLHTFAQHITLSIRDLPMYIAYYNSLIFAFLTFECYLWLVLFYFYYNYKKEC